MLCLRVSTFIVRVTCCSGVVNRSVTVTEIHECVLHQNSVTYPHYVKYVWNENIYKRPYMHHYLTVFLDTFYGFSFLM